MPATPTVASGSGAHAAASSTIPISAYTEVDVPCTGSEIDGLAVAPDGSAWITQPFDCTSSADDANTITRITPAGVVTVYHTPTTNSGPFGMTLGGNSQIYATEENASKLLQIDPSTGGMTEFSYPQDQGSAPNVRYIGTGADGNVWFTDIGTGSGTAKALGSFNVTTHQFAWYPLGMDVELDSKIIAGPNATIWVSNNDTDPQLPEAFGVYNESGATVAHYQVPNALGDLTLATDGNVWFTEEQAPSGGATQQSLALGRITPSGSITNFSLPPNDVHDAAITGIAQAHDGNVYAGLFNSNAIVQSTLSGTMKVFSFPASCNIVQPFLLAAGTGNTLWAADDGNTKRIYLIDLNQLH